jgi:NAD(P)H dehydrogenase (quinone)
MSKIIVIYATDYGNTKMMAEAVAEGTAGIEGTTTVTKSAEEITAEDLTSADGIILGSPVHMGSLDWRMKKMIDTVCSSLWMKDALQGKVGAVFATGSGFGGSGGGAEITMLSMLNNLAELGMILVPFPKSSTGYKQGGLQWGPYGRSADVDLKPTALTEPSLAAARAHGANVARVVAAVKGRKLFG